MPTYLIWQYFSVLLASSFWIVPAGRLQETRVAAETGSSKTTKSPACLGPLSEAPLEEDDVLFTVK